MNDLELQEHLLYITELKVKALHSKKIRTVTAIWQDDTAHISFYFGEQPTELELEDAAVACTEIVAHMPRGMLEENYITLRYPNPLPEKYLAYKQE